MSCAVCSGGQNQILSLDVPTTDRTDGTSTDVSNLIADKTVEISGTYVGQYVILGSHDGRNYVPLLTFNSGSGVQSVRQTLNVTLKYMKVRRRAQNPSGPITVSVGSAVVCECEGSNGASEASAMELYYARLFLENEQAAHLITKGLNEALSNALAENEILVNLMGTEKSAQGETMNRVMTALAALDQKVTGLNGMHDSLGIRLESTQTAFSAIEAANASMRQEVPLKSLKELFEKEKLDRAEMDSRLISAIAVLDKKIASLEGVIGTEEIEAVIEIPEPQLGFALIDQLGNSLFPGLNSLKFWAGIALGAAGGAVTMVLTR